MRLFNIMVTVLVFNLSLPLNLLAAEQNKPTQGSFIQIKTVSEKPNLVTFEQCFSQNPSACRILGGRVFNIEELKNLENKLSKKIKYQTVINSTIAFISGSGTLLVGGFLTISMGYLTFPLAIPTVYLTYKAADGSMGLFELPMKRNARNLIRDQSAPESVDINELSNMLDALLRTI